MIKIKSIIAESESRIKPISEEQIIKWIESNVGADNYVKSAPIFRGGIPKSIKYGYIKPSTSTRKSAHTKNYYTLMMDNKSEWKKYPKRSKSIVCSTSYNTASMYGSVGIVIPKRGATIAICPADDLWMSFGATVGRYFFDLNTMNNFIDGLAKDFGIKLDDTNHDTFKNQLDNLGDKIQLKYYNNEKIATKFRGSDYNFMSDFIKSGVRLYWFLSDLLDPTANAFSIKKFPVARLPHDKELWLSGECVIINEFSLDEINKYFGKN